MNTLKNILINEKIDFRTITSKGQKNMFQIHKKSLNQWLKKVIKNEGLKFVKIDSTVLIFES